MTINPYQTTDAAASAPEALANELDLAPEVVAQLTGARPFMFIVSVLAIGFGGLTLVGGILNR